MAVAAGSGASPIPGRRSSRAGAPTASRPPSASVRESRWMPTRTCGTSWRSAASADANSSVSRTTTSGRHASTIASMRGSAARACRPMNSSWTTWAMPGRGGARPDRRPRRARRARGAARRRRRTGARRAARAARPIRAPRRGRRGRRRWRSARTGSRGRRGRPRAWWRRGSAWNRRTPPGVSVFPLRSGGGLRGDDWAPAGPTAGIEGRVRPGGARLRAIGRSSRSSCPAGARLHAIAGSSRSTHARATLTPLPSRR